ISEIIKFVKGSSSHYINERKLLNTNFMWQIGYGAFSVDHSNIDYIANYIRNQKRHHKMNDVWVDHEIDITQQ
ncbi:MAG: transposase, partial [Bacteroidia bacterium]|nr:transposase [Bacteroidia bacterium]